MKVPLETGGVGRLGQCGPPNAWFLFILFLPLFGVFIYLIAWPADVDVLEGQPQYRCGRPHSGEKQREVLARRRSIQNVAP
jgi:hypothetical protein